VAETVYVSGLKELHARLQALADTVGGKKAAKPVVHALRKAAKILQADAIARVHKKSGTLAANIITTHPRTKVPGLETINVTIRAKAKRYKANVRNERIGRSGGKYRDYGPLFYARFLEFGTSHQPAYPFLRPAFEAHKAELPEVVAADIKDGLDKAVGAPL
jgi:HK97 gp10 family phage protein